MVDTCFMSATTLPQKHNILGFIHLKAAFTGIQNCLQISVINNYAEANSTPLTA